MTKHHNSEIHGIRRLVDRLLHHNANQIHKSQSSFFSKYHCPDAEISLGIWNAAYNALRDNLGSAGLVTAYEAILSQELPHGHVIGGMNSSFGTKSDEERLKDLTSITDAGLHKTRTSKASQVGDSARILLKSSKDIIESAWAVYPSTAVAWSGICILTPLLLDPILQVEDMRRGAMHVLGRIPWYMHLSELLLSSSWKDKQDFQRQEFHTREYLIQLYRKVLEFEMNCVCAAASTWNKAAKNVVGWNGLNRLVEAIKDADDHITKHMDTFSRAEVNDALLKHNRDLDPLSCGEGFSDDEHFDGLESTFHHTSSGAAETVTGRKHGNKPARCPSVRI